MSKIYLDWNLGLGDAIICNGLVRELAKIYEDVYIPSEHHNYESIRIMFSDDHNIRVGYPSKYPTTENSKDNNCESLVIGCNNPRFKEFRSFDVAFYELAGVPFEKRWSSFNYPKKSITYDLPPSYILKHDDESRGFAINSRHLNPTYPILNFEGHEAVTDYIPLIENAMEIHCIDSSMIHLVDSVKPKGQLFYHKYARNNGPFHQTVKKLKWNVLE